MVDFSKSDKMIKISGKIKHLHRVLLHYLSKSLKKFFLE